MYPTPSGTGGTDRGRYLPDGAFSVDFYINPRYQNDSDAVDYKAGTILHLSSTLAISLVSGSSKDENGKANGFRIMLQMGEDAGRAPSTIHPDFLPSDKIFHQDTFFEIVSEQTHNIINQIDIEILYVVHRRL